MAPDQHHHPSSCGSQRHAPGHAPPTAPPVRVCPGCETLAEASLLELPTLFDMCADALDPPPVGPRPRARGNRPRGIVLAEPATAARATILGVLRSWGGLVTTERETSGPDELGVEPLAGFLGTHLGWLLRHPAAPDLVDELSELSAMAEAALRPRRDFHAAAGPCPHPGCEQLVYASTRAGDEPCEVGCPAGHVVPPHRWLSLLANGKDGEKARSRGKEHSK